MRRRRDWGLLAAACLSNALPPRAALGLATWIADQWARNHPATRAVIQANLGRLLGRAPTPEETREVFRHFGWYLTESFTAHRPRRSAVTVEGLEHLDRFLRRGGGAIILTAHLGNWELGGVVLTRLGYPLSVVAWPHAAPATNLLFDHQRARCGVQTIPSGAGSAEACIRALRAGRLVALVSDRLFLGDGQPVRLCGAVVQMPRGPATLSLRTHSPIVPTFFVRSGPGAGRLVCDPPIEPVEGDTVATMTQAYAAVIERYVTQYPTQWLHFQRLPPAECPPLERPAGEPVASRIGHE